MAQTLRTVVGIPVPSEQVASGPGSRGLWLVAGLRDLTEGKLTARRVWLYRIADITESGSIQPVGQIPGDPLAMWSPFSSRWMSVVSYTPRGQTPDTSLAPGTVVDAMAHRYPGSGVWRGLISQRFNDLPLSGAAGWQPTPLTTAQQATEHRALLERNPWADVSPACLRVRVAPDPWRAEDVEGNQVRITGVPEDLFRLHGLLCGQFGTVLGEWNSGNWSDQPGFRPSALVAKSGLELL
jgi:hypothetical protein